MRNFLVLLSKKQPDLLTDKLLHAHVDYLKNLKKSGDLILCGPFVDNQGAMLIIKGTDEQQVREILQNDPFIKERYYQSLSIHEFIEANETNNWLNLSED